MRRKLFWGAGVALTVLLMWGETLLFSQERESADYSAPGPHPIGIRTVTVSVTPGRTWNATLYYPAPAQGGTDAPLDPAAAPYPAIAFGHGFLQAVSSYDSTLSHLASWGFLVIAPASEGGLFPDHSQFADDLRDSLTWLTWQNDDPDSFLFGGVNNNRFGLSGHSMGGGASLLAASRDIRILTVANLAAAETNPSAINALSAITRPVQLISGSEDTITPPGSHQNPMYAAANAPRQRPLIEGGWHCGFQDSSFPLFCDSGSLPRADQLALTRGLLTRWFLLYLYEETALWQAVWGSTAQLDPQVTFTGDDGISLEPAEQAGEGMVGQPVTYSVTISNSGAVTTAYALALTSAWPTHLEEIVTTPLAPGETTSISFQVVPSETGQELTALTVRSLYDGGTTDQATAWTSADFPPTATPTTTPTATPTTTPTATPTTTPTATPTTTPTTTPTATPTATPEPFPPAYRLWLPVVLRAELKE